MEQDVNVVLDDFGPVFQSLPCHAVSIHRWILQAKPSWTTPVRRKEIEKWQSEEEDEVLKLLK